jgi:hypothetical protein
LCSACSGGQFQENNAQTTCKSCAKGQFQESNAQTSCKNCPKGQFQESNAQTSCKSCLKGQYQENNAQITCKSCAKGHFQESDAQTSCKGCPKGQFQESGAQISCKAHSTCSVQSVAGTPTSDRVCQQETATAAADALTAPLAASLTAIFAVAAALVTRRGVRRRRAARDYARDVVLFEAYVAPKDLDPGSTDAQEELLKVEAALDKAGKQGLGDPAGDLAACFEAVKAVLGDVVAGADPVQLRAVARLAGTEHKHAYAACYEILSQDVGHAWLLGAAAAAAAQTAAGHPHQAVGDLYALQTQARLVLPAFANCMRGITAAFDGRRTKKDKKPAVVLQLSTPKHLYRCCEKMCLKPGAQRFTAANVCDVVRCIVSCDDCSLMAEVLQALLTCPDVAIVRVKDRANHMTSMNWMDVMVNLTLAGDRYQHVCEVQIVHAKMLLARSGLGGHVPYGKLRAATEIMALRASEPGLAKRGGEGAVARAAAEAGDEMVENPMRVREQEQAVANDISHLVISEMLPEGWQKLTDPSSGNDYFANQATGETAWTKPDNTALKQVDPTRSATAAEASAKL